MVRNKDINIMAKTLYIEDDLLGMMIKHFEFHWVDENIPYLADKDGNAISADEYDFFPIPPTEVSIDSNVWEYKEDTMICDGILLFGDGCMEFHDNKELDAYNWDCFTDESVEKITEVVRGLA